MKAAYVIAGCGLLLLCVLTVPIESRQLLQQDEAQAPAPAGSHSPCRLPPPSNAVINAPDQEPGAQFLYYYYEDYYYEYYSYYYTTTYYFDFDFGRRLQQQGASAPAPESAPLCCPTQNVKQGDTVASLLKASGQPSQDPSFFYALNPDIKSGTTLQPGSTVTVPCYRILSYFAETAPPAPSPGPGPSGNRRPASG